jgi:hypothetical protein
LSPDSSVCGPGGGGVRLSGAGLRRPPAGAGLPPGWRASVGARRVAGRAGVTRRRGEEQERWFAFPTFPTFRRRRQYRVPRERAPVPGRPAPHSGVSRPSHAEEKSCRHWR